MANVLQRSVSGAGALLRRRYLERFAEPAALKRAWREAPASPIALDIPGEDLGVYERGEPLTKGIFGLAGADVRCAPESLWAQTPPSRSWRRAAHGFGWLYDLGAIGGARAHAIAAPAISAWIDAHQAYDAEIWSLELTARRLDALITHAGLLTSDAPADGAVIDLPRAIGAHALWLGRLLSPAPQGLTKLRAAIAFATATAAVTGLEERHAEGLAMLAGTLENGLREDGSWSTRRPQDAFEALSLLNTLEQRFAHLDVDTPDAIYSAMALAARAVRFFRSADGGLPCFHGGAECGDGRVDRALSAVETSAPPKRLPHAGFERIACGRAAVIMDVGRTEDDVSALSAHASALAIETTVGRRRLICNCGPTPEDAGERPLAFRGEAAHSTITVDDAPFTLRRAVGGDGDTALIGPPVVTSERKEERNGMWLLATHDGYAPRFGLTATRRLFLSADGGDFRGEDSLSVETDEDGQTMSRALQRLPRGRRDAGVPITARFHLHPEVSATMVADGEAATLRLPHGEVWVMRQAGGSLALEDSRYTGREGRPEPTKQLVIRSAARRELTQIRWAFRRVGELSQLPRDLTALGVTLDDIDATEPRPSRPTRRA